MSPTRSKPVYENTALLRLLDGCAAWQAQYGQALSDHQPMALVALARLGADDDHLKRYAQRYPKRVGLKPVAKPDGWPAGDAWPDRLGDAAAHGAYLHLFTQWIAHEGSGDVLMQVLPQLMPGCSGAAFHGLIRTAHAVQARHSGEVAQGLAHWAATWQSLGPWPTDVKPSEDDPVHLLRRLPAQRSKAGLIAQRMAAAAKGGAVSGAVAALRLNNSTLEKLANAAAYAYAHSGSFTALHLVTAAQAMRCLAPFFDAQRNSHGQADAAPSDQTRALRWFWQAYAHGVVAAQLRPSPAPVQAQPWDEILNLALQAQDEHVIKLVDACREQEQHYGSGATGQAGAQATATLWRLAATRAVAPLAFNQGSATA